MRVILMHKTEPRWEAGERPSPEMIAGMGHLLGEMAQAGALLAAAGLRASALGVRLRFAGGERNVTRGPFAGANELTAGIAIVRVQSLDEAIEWATRFASIVGDVEIDIRPVTEPWDLGLVPKPAGMTTARYMLVRKGDRISEAGLPPPVLAGLRALAAEMTKAGVLEAAEEFQPSSNGMRLRFAAGKRAVTDGPFTESKELIAGFVMLQVASKDEVIEWASWFAAVAGDVEIDARVLYEPETPGGPGTSRGSPAR